MIKLFWMSVGWVLCAVLSGCGGGGSDGRSVSEDDGLAPNVLLASAPGEIKPFIWFFANFDNSESGFQAQLDYGDPFRATTLLIQDWLKRRDVPTTVARVDKIVAKWRLDEPDGKLTYTFAYGRLPAGWRSGMDSWSFPMLVLSLWQETGEPRFKALADKLIATASKNVAEGGVVWRDDKGGCWFSEYAWDGMSPADEFSVLNGHLYALQAIRMMARATARKALYDLYDCGLRATKDRANGFEIGKQWVRYMLNPSTINQTHYVIYETMQLDALSQLDPDPFYAEQATLRRKLLQRYFPVYMRMDKTGNRLMMSALGAPHPYSIDTYALALRCRDGKLEERHAITNPTDTRTPIPDRVFLDEATALDPATTSCSIEAQYVGLTQALFDTAVVPLAGPTGNGQVIDARFEAILDAQLLGPDKAVVDPARRSTDPAGPSSYLDTQGRLIFTPAAPIAWSDADLLGIEFGVSGEIAVGVSITSNGSEYFRYYPHIPANAKTVMLLSSVGFDGGDAINSIDKITVFVYTDRQPLPVTVSSIRLLKFANQAELYGYFRAEAPSFHTE